MPRLAVRNLPHRARLVRRRAGASSATRHACPGSQREIHPATMAALGRGRGLLSSCAHADREEEEVAVLLFFFLHFFIMSPDAWA